MNDSSLDDGFVLKMAEKFDSLSAETLVPVFLLKAFTLQLQASLSRSLERTSRVLGLNSHLHLEIISRTARIKGSQVLDP